MSEFLAASGPSLFDAAFLGDNDGAWWVGVVRRAHQNSRMPLDIGVRHGSRTPLTGIWRSPTGGVFVSGEAGVLHNPDPWGRDPDAWTARALDAPLTGITGVDDRTVLASGIRPTDGHHVLRIFNGSRWNPLGSPGFVIRDMVISAADRIWIAGDGVGRWDGTGWEVLEGGTYVAIAAPSDDRVIALTDDGTFGRVTPGGFDVLGQVEGGVALAVWRDRIWIGAGDRGLWRAGGGTVECVRADRHATALESHTEGLMITTPDLLSSTADGEGFPGGCRGVLDGLQAR